MANGSLTIQTDTYVQLKQTFQRVLCWAAADRGKVFTDSSGPVLKIVVPEAVFAGKGALVLKRAGTDLVAGYVAGTNIVASSGNGSAIQQNVNTCPASTNQPTVTSFTTNVGGNPLATSLVYANVGAAGTVDILWGDGTSDLAQAEAATIAHTYPSNGIYNITIRDVSVPTDLAVTTVHVP
jgi:hypothetical protein